MAEAAQHQVESGGGPNPRRTGRAGVRDPAVLAGLAIVAIGVAVLLVGLLRGGDETPRASDPVSPRRLRVDVVSSAPHDRSLFTQGLDLHGGVRYESAGLEGHSLVRRTAADGTVTEVAGPDNEFFEGLAVTPDAVWQLTWKNGTAYQRDPETLAVRRKVRYAGEGWGLCYDATRRRLVMSDGSARLTFRDPRSFAVTGGVSVTQSGRPVEQLNELECRDGTVYANVWQTDRLIRVRPSDGVVTADIDADGLLKRSEADGADVLNGIVALPTRGRFVVTGKLWPKEFVVRFVPVSQAEPGR